MATLIPLAINDVNKASIMKATGDKNAYKKLGNKYKNIAMNPIKYGWNSVRNIFGFGIMIPHTKPYPRKKAKPRGRPRKKK